MRGGIQSIKSSGITAAIITTFIARAIAAFGSIIFVVLIGREYGPAMIGAFAIAQGFLLGFAIFARYGMDGCLVLYVGREQAARESYLLLRRSIIRAVGFAVPLALLMAVTSAWLESAFDIISLKGVIDGCAIALPAFTASFVLSGFMKGTGKPAAATLMENGAVLLLATLVLFTMNHFFHFDDGGAVGLAIAISAWIVFLIGLVPIYKCSKENNHGSNRLDESIAKEFDQTSSSFFVMSLAGFGQSVVSIFVVGAFLTASELGVLKSAQQLSGLVGFVLIVINAVYPAKFAALFHRGELTALERLAKQSAALGLILAVPVLAVFILFPTWVMSLFGSGFQHGAVLLQVLAIGQLVNVATGSVGFLLNMTGNQALMRNIVVLTGILGLAILCALSVIWGAVGAAIALSAMIIIQNMAAAWFVWRRLAIVTIPLVKI